MTTNAQILAALETNNALLADLIRTLSPAAVVETAAPAKARKATPKVAAPKAPAKKTARTLCRKNRLGFVADNPWAAGMSVWAIHQAVRAGEATVSGAWILSAKREEILDAEA